MYVLNFLITFDPLVNKVTCQFAVLSVRRKLIIQKKKERNIVKKGVVNQHEIYVCIMIRLLCEGQPTVFVLF